MKSVRVLLVYANGVMQNPPPVSIALFSALLNRRAGVEVRLFDTTIYDFEGKTSDQFKERNLQVKPYDFADRGVTLKTADLHEDFRRTVWDFAPDLIALSCNQVTYALGMSLLQKVAEHPALKLVGGIYASMAPGVVLNQPGVDLVCVGEGEGALVDLVEALANGRAADGIPNLWRRRGPDLIRNPLRPLVDLDALPLPDYDIFAPERYYRPMDGTIHKLFPIETMRGCYYRCTYCNSPTMSALYAAQGIRGSFRKKSIAAIGRELDYLTGKYRAEYIYFLSDMLLCLNEREFDEFCRMYEKYALPFWCQSRAEMITYERAVRLKNIGCARMSIGVEQGNEAFRKKVLRREMSNERIIQAFADLARAGIATTANNIIGFPDETRELVFDTIRLNRQLVFDTTNATAFTPFAGTELHARCVRKGWLAPDQQLGYVTVGSILQMPHFTSAEINGLVRTFVLYTRLPEADFDRIRRAETDDAEGNAVFEELRQRYLEMGRKAPA